MDHDLQRRALDAFDEVCTLPLSEQEAWIERTCAGEPALRDAVTRLIAAAARAGMIPTEPPEPAAPAGDPSMPDRIGPYRPTALIGQGGMGRVYRAERADGHFDQVVAIKVIAARLFSGTAAAQFRVERQILAKLDHPNIARLFDGGDTDQGLAYIVMELIHGQPITVYADALDLDVPARLRLFRQVCGAVQYAHQQLVVHADIKPGNILVDAAHGVKLLDFGIAALVIDDADADGHRATGRTPAWASPQLVAGNRPTPPDDIFALGLLLRELAGDKASNADLSAIADKAAAADPADRYASADALSADVQRWLAGRPVVARPAGNWHRMWLFWGRNRLSVIVGVLVALGLVVGLALTTTLYLRAETARRQTQERFQEVRALSRFMLGDLNDALEQTPGTSRIRRALAVRGRVYLEKLSRIPDAPIDLRIETAKGYSRTGEILASNASANTGDPKAGQAALLRADHDLTGLLAQMPGRTDIRLALASNAVVQATLATFSFNDTAGALRHVDRADRLLDGIPPGSADHVEAGWWRWRSRINRANTLNQDGRFAEMIPILETALKDGRALPVTARHVIDRPVNEGATLRLLGDAQTYLDHTEQALHSYEEAARISEEGRLRTPSAKLFDRAAYSDYDVASTLLLLKRPKEALEWINKALAVMSALHTFDDSPRTQQVYNMIAVERAVTLGELHRYDEGIAGMLANIAERKRLVAAEPDNYEARRAVPVALRPLAEIYFDAGRIGDACRTLEETRADWADVAKHGGLTHFDQTDEMSQIADLQKKCPRHG